MKTWRQSSESGACKGAKQTVSTLCSPIIVASAAVLVIIFLFLFRSSLHFASHLPPS